MTTRLEQLCDALRARGAVVIIQSRTSMRVRGKDLEALADEIRYWKPELIRALYTANGAEPFACSRCGCEVVLVAGHVCPWCAAAGWTAPEFRPTAPALSSRRMPAERSENPSQLSQGPKTADWDKIDEIRPSADAHAA